MITVNKTEFLNAVKAVKTSCSRNKINPILEGINLTTVGQGLQLTATDCTNSARTIIEANVKEPMDVCINAEKLENIVNVLDDIITIDCPDTTATFKSGKTHFNIVVMQATDFPQTNFEFEGKKVVLQKDDFIKGINKTIIATATETQNILNGICFTFNENGYEMAATDGNRLSQVKYDNAETDIKEGQYIIPHNVLSSVIRCINNDVELYFQETRVILKSGNYLYSSSLFDGTFPKYQQLIPQNQKYKAVVDRAELLKSLEKVAIMSDNRTNITVFDFKNGELHLTTSCEGGKAEDTIEVSFDDELKIAFNFRFILEGIKAMQSDAVEFGMSGATGACLIKGDFCYLVMPIMQKG